MVSIKNIKAREILDSRGNPTVEVDVFVGKHRFTASVPSGASRGKHESLELRDGGKRMLGLGVEKACSKIEKEIAPVLRRVKSIHQERIDTVMQVLDGTENKSDLGTNAILAVSLAVARAGAFSRRKHLFDHIAYLAGRKRNVKLPRPFFNVINGGKHADNKLSFQEFMIAPKLGSFRKNLQAGSEIYHVLKKELHKKYGKGSTNVGDEGGFAPDGLKGAEDALKILVRAITKAGYRGKCEIAIDAAASEFFVAKRKSSSGSYLVDGKKLSSEKLLNFYLNLVKKYPIVSIEDPFQQEDFESFAELLKNLEKLNELRGRKVQVVGDDLTVTHPKRIGMAIDKKSCDCLLLKVNQIGTLTEALQAANLAFSAGWKVMVSHRSGETEDSFIADLAVGLGCGMIKAGAPCRGERLAKYNKLLRIEEEIND